LLLEALEPRQELESMRMPQILIQRTGCALLLLISSLPTASGDVIYPPPQFAVVATGKIAISQNHTVADVYYPNPPDLASGNYTFPVGVFLQGVHVTADNYSKYARIVASYGFVMVVPDHYWGVGPYKVVYPVSSDVDAVMNQMQIENESPQSPLYKILDPTKAVLMGHSLGGCIAVSECAHVCGGTPEPPPYTVLAGAVYGAGRRSMLEDADLTGCGVPVMLIQGNLDTYHLWTRSVGTFRAYPGLPKSLVMVPGANHYGIINVNNQGGVIPDPRQQTLNQDQSIETIACWHGLFMRATVYQDPVAISFVYGNGGLLDPYVNVYQETEAAPAVLKPIPDDGSGTQNLSGSVTSEKPASGNGRVSGKQR